MRFILCFSLALWRRQQRHLLQRRLRGRQPEQLGQLGLQRGDRDPHDPEVRVGASSRSRQ